MEEKIPDIEDVDIEENILPDINDVSETTSIDVNIGNDLKGEELPLGKKKLNSFVIGDPHFRSYHMKEGKELVERCLEIAHSINPEFIVILGDILDTHEVTKNEPFRLAYSFIEKLSKIAHTYVLIGNHDLINQSQFLSDKHFFGPLKYYPNVSLVDKPIKVTFNKTNYPTISGTIECIMCPYVEKGKFIKALDTIDNWKECHYIFAHQEFKGAKENKMESTEGDVWKKSYPYVISGHIHTQQLIGENIFYPGSPLQIKFNEDPDKDVCEIIFNGPYSAKIYKISTLIKGKKEIKINIDEMDNFDSSILDKYYIKLNITASTEQFSSFKKSSLYKEFKESGIKIIHSVNDQEKLYTDTVLNLKKNQTSFESVLRELVKRKPKNIRNAYNLLNENNILSGSESVENKFLKEEHSDTENGKIELIFEDE